MALACLVSDCLNSYEKYREINIMMRLGPTLTGDKPMHIFCFNKNFKFIDNILEDIDGIFSESKNIKYNIVESNNNSIKIIFYNTIAMERLLSDQRNLKFLHSYGFGKNMSSHDYMLSLADNLRENKLPSEYGIFFGYPLKDVIGFMGHPSLKHVKTKAWKVYGDPRLSDIIFKKFKEAEDRVLNLCQTLSLKTVVRYLDTVY